MHKYRLAGVAAAAFVTTPISAYALNFNFSFTGIHHETVTGEIFGLAASGPSAARQVVIDSGSSSPYDNYDVSSPGHQLYLDANRFTVSHGRVVGANFNPGYKNGLSAAQLGFNVASTFFGSHFTYDFYFLFDFTPGLNNLTNIRTTANFRGFDGITFTNATTVPEPASIALPGAGLPGISVGQISP